MQAQPTDNRHASREQSLRKQGPEIMAHAEPNEAERNKKAGDHHEDQISNEVGDSHAYAAEANTDQERGNENCAGVQAPTEKPVRAAFGYVDGGNESLNRLDESNGRKDLEDGDSSEPFAAQDGADERVGNSAQSRHHRKGEQRNDARGPKIGGTETLVIVLNLRECRQSHLADDGADILQRREHQVVGHLVIAERNRAQHFADYQIV